MIDELYYKNLENANRDADKVIEILGGKELLIKRLEMCKKILSSKESDTASISAAIGVIKYWALMLNIYNKTTPVLNGRGDIEYIKMQPVVLDEYGTIIIDGHRGR